MGRTIRHASPEPIERPDRGNLPTLRVTQNDAAEASLLECDLYHFRHSSPPDTWPAWVLRELGKRCAAGRPETLGLPGVLDWGALPSTRAGSCRRYYFLAVAAGDGRYVMAGSVVATNARAVHRWLRDDHRVRSGGNPDEYPVVSRDVLLLRPLLTR